jgi:hypothetical protein
MVSLGLSICFWLRRPWVSNTLVYVSSCLLTSAGQDIFFSTICKPSFLANSFPNSLPCSSITGREGTQGTRDTVKPLCNDRMLQVRNCHMGCSSWGSVVHGLYRDLKATVRCLYLKSNGKIVRFSGSDMNNFPFAKVILILLRKMHQKSLNWGRYTHRIWESKG